MPRALRVKRRLPLHGFIVGRESPQKTFITSLIFQEQIAAHSLRIFKRTTRGPGRPRMPVEVIVIE